MDLGNTCVHGSRADLSAGTLQLRRVSVRQRQWPVLSGAQNTSYGTLHITCTRINAIDTVIRDASLPLYPRQIK